MSVSVKKTVLLTLSGIALIIFGALGSWAVGKVLPPNGNQTPVATAQVVAGPAITSTVAPVVATPAQVVAGPTTPATAAPVAVSPTQVVSSTTTTTTTTAPGVVPAGTIVEGSVAAGPVMAQVIKVRPYYIVKTVPQRVCQDVPRTVMGPSRGPSGAGAVLGGVAGGIAGHQIGQGRGNVVATIGGAILGAAVGNQVEGNMQRPQTQVVYETVCSTAYVKKSVRSGYEVTYIYNGQKGKTIMKNRPVGNTIPLTLKPVG